MKKLVLFSMVLLAISFAQATVEWQDGMSALSTAGWTQRSNATNEAGDATGGIRVVGGTKVQMNSWWDNAGWTQIYKNTGVVIANNTDYTLTMTMQGSAVPAAVPFSMQSINGAVWTIIVTASPAQTALMADYTISFSTKGGLNAGTVGNSIGVSVDPGWWNNISVDNMKIDSIPEPATMILLGLGSLLSLKKRS